MTVRSDIVDGASLSQDASGIQVDRVFILDGVSGASPNRLQDALNVDGVPKFGETHPTIPGITAVKVAASPINGEPTQVRVRVTYRAPTSGEQPPDPFALGDIELDAGTVSEETIVDINGDKMIVGFRGNVLKNGARVEVVTAGRVQVERVQAQVTITRIEPDLNLDKLLTFSGTINASGWSGFPAKTWLCRMRSRPNKGQGHTVSYVFTYNPETWDVIVNASDKGVIPVDAEKGNGILDFQVYRTTDFNALGISIPR